MTQGDLDRLHAATITRIFPQVHVQEAIPGGLLVFLCRPMDELYQNIAVRFPSDCGTEVVFVEGEDHRDLTIDNPDDFVAHLGALITKTCRDPEVLAHVLFFADFHVLVSATDEDLYINIFVSGPELKWELGRLATGLTEIASLVTIRRGAYFLTVGEDTTAASIEHGGEWEKEEIYTDGVEVVFRRLALTLSQGMSWVRPLSGGRKPRQRGNFIQFFEGDRELDGDEVEDDPWNSRMQEVAAELRKWSPGDGLPRYATIIERGEKLRFCRDGWRIELTV